MKIPAFVTVALLLAPVIACFAEPIDLDTQQSLSPQEAASLKQDVIFLDVRTTLEWFRGHIKGAVHIPYDEVAERITSEIADRSTPIVIYCASGGRATHVTAAMRELGYTAVPVVNGGYRQLVANGMQKD